MADRVRALLRLPLLRRARDGAGEGGVMRILVGGDLQIGAGQTIGRTLADYDELLARIVAIAEAQQADLFLGLGDAFQSRTTNRDQDECFQRFLLSMSDVCPVLWVNGNHDWRGYERATTVGIFGERSHSITISSTPDHRWYSTPDSTVVVATLPWAALGHLVAGSDGDADRAELVALAAEHLVTIAAELRDQIDPGAIAILAGHWAVTGASLPTGLPVDMLSEPVIDIAALEAQGWDVIAMGHVHKAQSIGERGGAFVCGSPYVCDWGETGFDHGVWLLEPDAASREGAQKTALTPSFIRVPDRQFRTLDLTYLADEGPPYEIAEASVMDDVIRVVLAPTAEQAGRLDVSALKRAIYDAGAHFVAPIRVDVERVERQRVEGLTEELSEMEAVRLWLAANGINGTREQAVVERTERYLESVR